MTVYDSEECSDNLQDKKISSYRLWFKIHSLHICAYAHKCHRPKGEVNLRQAAAKKLNHTSSIFLINSALKMWLIHSLNIDNPGVRTGGVIDLCCIKISLFTSNATCRRKVLLCHILLLAQVQSLTDNIQWESMRFNPIQTESQILYLWTNGKI